MLHQLGADFTANPFSSQIREVLLGIEPTAKERFPQRRAAREVKPAEEEAAPPADQQPAAAPQPAGKKKKGEAAAEAPQAEAAAPSAPAPVDGKKGPGPKKAAAEAGAEKKLPHDHPSDGARATHGAQHATEKSPTQGLSKRKPR
jgi:hypothetical protein